VAEFYPRAGDPVLGIWAHRQALAARDAGAEVRVVVLHRLVPPRAAVAAGPASAAAALAALLRQPRIEELDGLAVHYVGYISPPRSFAYAAWGVWAAPALRRFLRRLRQDFAFELIHAHNAVPAGDAVRRVGLDVPTVVSVHGGDVLFTAPRMRGGERAVGRALEHARLVLANSEGIRLQALEHGAARVRVVHLGADAAPAVTPAPDPPAIVTVAHLAARKRHADVIGALALLRERQPTLRYRIVGDGPERAALERLAMQTGVGDRVEFLGQLPHGAAVEQLRHATLMAMPSVDEAFGVAYVEALAAGVPAIGCAGEPGPQEIAAEGEGMLLVKSGDTAGLAEAIAGVVQDPSPRLREAALQTGRLFSWERCGRETVDCYAEALS
jgi:teichuronic acid biosynthesis glycosyltransferase TuaC